MFSSLLLSSLLAIGAVTNGLQEKSAEIATKKAVPATEHRQAARAVLVAAAPAGMRRVERSSPGSVRTAARNRKHAQNAKLRQKKNAYLNEQLAFSIPYPKGWAAHEVMQTMQYSDEENSGAQRVVIFSAPGAELTASGTAVPFLPAFEYGTALVADYTDLNTISLVVEDLPTKAPSVEELTEDYVEVLRFFDEETEVTVCDCTKKFMGKLPAKLFYWYADDGSIVIQIVAVADRRAYLFTMKSDSDQYDAMYESLLTMVARIRTLDGR